MDFDPDVNTSGTVAGGHGQVSGVRCQVSVCQVSGVGEVIIEVSGVRCLPALGSRRSSSRAPDHRGLAPSTWHPAPVTGCQVSTSPRIPPDRSIRRAPDHRGLAPSLPVDGCHGQARSTARNQPRPSSGSQRYHRLNRHEALLDPPSLHQPPSTNHQNVSDRLRSSARRPGAPVPRRPRPQHGLPRSNGGPTDPRTVRTGRRRTGARPDATRWRRLP